MNNSFHEIKKRMHDFCLYLLAIFCIGFVSCQHAVKYPEPVRENIEWCRVWLPNANQSELPRVLLIGDSIVVGYYPEVENQLQDKAYIGYLATSRSVCDPTFFDELRVVLKQYKYDVIHFNNGLHGWGYSEEQYQQGLEHLVAVLHKQAPNSQLIWAHSTPHNLGDQLTQLEPKNQRIYDRNQIATKIMQEANIPINDLFSLCYGKSEIYSSDRVHFKDEGKKLQAMNVVDSIQNKL